MRRADRGTRLLAVFSRLRFAWSRRRVDEDTKREIDAHLDLLAEKYTKSGMTPEEAYRAARQQFGNVTVVREEIHQMNGITWVDSLARDLAYALRQVRRSPGFSAIVIAVLGLGIGGTTAVFSVVDAVLLAPLPYEQPGQLVRLYMQEPDNPSNRVAGMAATRFQTLRERAASFDGLAATRSDGSLTGLDLFRDGAAQRLQVLRVTSDYFRTLRSVPFRGPGFGPDDESGTRRVVLSDALWRSRFNGDPSVIGTSVLLSGELYEIAGVASPGFQDPIAGAVDVWLPHKLRGDRDTQLSTVFGRMHASASHAQVNEELRSLSQTMEPSEDDRRVATRIVAVALHEDVVASSRDFVQLLLIAVGLVLLVACVNVANLVLVRATGRVQEFSVRAALGCGRGRLMRQLLVETLVLAALGGAVGLVLATVGVKVLQMLGRDALPRVEAIGFDPIVLLFAAVVTMATALASGLMPAVQLTRSDPNRALAQQSRSGTHSRSNTRLRSGLAAAQLALALALLAGAGVLSVSFYRLMNVDLGFRTHRALTFDVNLPSVRYGDAARRAQFQEDLAERLAAIPGVTKAGGTSRLPATGSFHPWPFYIETGPLAGTRVPQPDPEHRTVSGEFFEALAIPVLAGRTFDERDDVRAPMRVVVSANLARLAFPGMPFENVVGQRIAVLQRRSTREIIGVVGDVAMDAYGKPTSAVYSAHRQFAGSRNWALTHVVATNVAPEKILPAVRAVVAAIDPELAMHRTAVMSEVVGRGTSRERFALVLIGAFAAVALTLAAIGLYGVIAHVVRQRTPEIGIRIALGASAAQVRALVLRQAVVVLSVGVVTGIGGALVLGRWLSSLLFETSPWDARVVAATVGLLTITGLLAAWLPATRASQMDARAAIQEG
jgi:predicted permease